MWSRLRHLFLLRPWPRPRWAAGWTTTSARRCTTSSTRSARRSRRRGCTCEPAGAAPPCRRRLLPCARCELHKLDCPAAGGTSQVRAAALLRCAPQVSASQPPAPAPPPWQPHRAGEAGHVGGRPRAQPVLPGQRRPAHHPLHSVCHRLLAALPSHPICQVGRTPDTHKCGLLAGGQHSPCKSCAPQPGSGPRCTCGGPRSSAGKCKRPSQQFGQALFQWRT